MRKLIIAEFITLDGVIQAPGGDTEDTDGGFAHGGWTLPYWHDDIGAHFFKSMSESDTMLFGRKTWQIHGTAFEPVADGTDAFFDTINAVPKVVVSTTLTSAAAWRNSTLVSSNVLEAVRDLKAQPGNTILMDGSSVLAQTLLANDLVDELRLHVYPLSLGGGKKLYPAGKRLEFQLVESEPLPTGVVYQRLTRL